MESNFVRSHRNVRFYLAEIGGSPVPVVTIKNKDGFAGVAIDERGTILAHGCDFPNESRLCSSLLLDLLQSRVPG
jgi:hypothetical protein